MPRQADLTVQRILDNSSGSIKNNWPSAYQDGGAVGGGNEVHQGGLAGNQLGNGGAAMHGETISDTAANIQIEETYLDMVMSVLNK